MRGRSLAEDRLTKGEFERLCAPARAHFYTLPHYTGAEWIERGAFPEATGRNVTLVLTPGNMEKPEGAGPDEIIAEQKRLDEEFYAAPPPAVELAKQVGKPENMQTYRFRDLFLEWQGRYPVRTGMQIWDMNDERHSFSVRMYPEREW